MQFTKELLSGKLIKRYKRFLADIELDNGEVITAHCPNSGSMLGVKTPGLKVWVSRVENPNAKLRYRWDLSMDDMGELTGVNTHLTNKIVMEALELGKIKELNDYKYIKPEVKYGKENSRIDFLLSKDPEFKDNLCYLEVKNVHLSREKGLAEFPDAVTSRGAKHMRELAEIVKTTDYKAFVLFLIQRMDVQSFSIARDIDPGYYEEFKNALNSGVGALAYDCDIDELNNCVSLNQQIETLI